MIRRAAACCFVLSIFTSLIGKENNATSAPEVTKLSTNNIMRATAKKTGVGGLAARRVKQNECKMLQTDE